MADGPSAFYLAGSLDGSRPGVFYVNTYKFNSQPKYEMISLSLHESNPGHHFQSSFSMEKPDWPLFRKVMEDRIYSQSPSRQKFDELSSQEYSEPLTGFQLTRPLLRVGDSTARNLALTQNSTLNPWTGNRFMAQDILSLYINKKSGICIRDIIFLRALRSP